MRKTQLVLKRCIDIILSLTVLVPLSLIMLPVAVIIRLGSKGPALFIQTRLGYKGRTFRIYKFRTMIPGAAKMGTGVTTLPNDPRLTRVGRFLRKTSLDELPQLINVLKGDMSLVGPRPTVPEHLEYYGEFERKRLDMLPGITGLAMIRGRSSNPWSVRIKYDVEYVENYSLWLDVKIILKTIALVFSRKHTAYDYSQHGDAFDLSKPGESKDRRERRLEV